MGILDGLLNQVSGNTDIANLAAKVGLDPATAEQAVVALGAAHAQPGDTVETAAAQTGIDRGTLSQMVEHMGGEGALGHLSQMMQAHPQAASMLSGLVDRDGDGNPLNDVLGMAKGLFGKSS